MERPELRRRIGFVPSELNYYDGLTVKQFLQYSADFYGKPARDKFSFYSEKLKLDLKRRITDLSLGNRKKVGLVQALLHEPEFLFTRPVSRNSIFISKTAVLLTYITLLSVLFFITSVLSMEAVKDAAPRQLELSMKDKTLIQDHIKQHPDKIYQAFKLDENSFTEYSLSFASDLLGKNTAELEEINLDIDDMNKLIAEAMKSPEDFFESVLQNPQDYMSMFSVSPEDEAEFLQNVLGEQEEYRMMKESFYSAPDLFIQFFEENPELALSQFASEPGSMSEALELLKLPEDFEDDIFRKFKIWKLAVLSVYMYLLLMAIGAMVLFTSLMVKRGRSVTGLALGVVMFFYFLKSITGLAAGFSRTVEIIGYISPFAWIDVDINSLDYGFSWWRVSLFLLITDISFIAANIRLNKKDILV